MPLTSSFVPAGASHFCSLCLQEERRKVEAEAKRKAEAEAKRLAQEAEAQRRAEAKAEDFGMVSTEDERTSLLGLLDRLYML